VASGSRHSQLQQSTGSAARKYQPSSAVSVCRHAAGPDRHSGMLLLLLLLMMMMMMGG